MGCRRKAAVLAECHAHNWETLTLGRDGDRPPRASQGTTVDDCRRREYSYSYRYAFHV
jgi:hypothetical protein